MGKVFGEEVWIIGFSKLLYLFYRSLSFYWHECGFLNILCQYKMHWLRYNIGLYINNLCHNLLYSKLRVLGWSSNVLFFLPCIDWKVLGCVFVIINWFYRQWQTNTNDSLAPDTKHSFQLVHFHPTAGTHSRDDVFSLLTMNVAGIGEGEK